MERPLIFVPIERMEERYSGQWYHWFLESFKRKGITEVQTVGGVKPQKIETGQFLDVFNTNTYKMNQLIEIIDILKRGWKGGVIFFMDLWFPGIEALAYIRDNAKIDFEIKGILHAGSYDPCDFLSQNKCYLWAADLERSWIKLADEIFVATQFHKDLICSMRAGMHHYKIDLVRFPVFRDDVLAKTEKENIIVFPHRLAPEKAPEKFEALEKEFKSRFPKYADYRFVKTKDQELSKDEYHLLLAKSKVAVSYAEQETFGISMLEAENLGCFPLVPSRLSYVETFERYLKFNTFEQSITMLFDILENNMKPFPPRYEDNVDDIVDKLGVI